MTDTGYIDPPIVSDYTSIFNDAIAQLQTSVPGWIPSAGNLEVLILEIVSRMAADTADTASAVPRSIFRYFGKSILQLPANDAVRAAMDVTILASDAVGHTIPTGTQFFARKTDGTLVAFETIAPTVIPSGSNTVSTTLYAVVAGADANDIELDVTNTGLITALSYISGLDPQSPVTAGGRDAETDAEYLDRLVRYVRILAPRPVLADDYEVLLTSLIPQIDRVVAIDGFNPNDSTFNNARTVTVSGIDAAGNILSNTVKQQALDLIASKREPNFIIYFVDPTYTSVDVTFQVMARHGFSAVDVQARVAAAITSALQPYNWGREDLGDVKQWNLVTAVRYLDIVSVVHNVDGVFYIESLVTGLNGGAQTTADKTLTGTIPLPLPGTITGTVDGPA